MTVRASRVVGKALRISLAVLIPLAAFLGLLSCTPEGRHRTLAFFFDGVPPLHSPEEGPAPAPQPVYGAPVEAPRQPDIVWYEHKPTLDKGGCGRCHSRDASYTLVKPITEICVTCHEERTREYPYMHGPTAIGECATCHEAHRSPYKHLLLAPASKLCLRCHEGLPEDGHTAGCKRTTDEVDCTSCHNPHGGRDRYFLSGRPGSAEGSGPASSSPVEGR